MPSSGYQEGAGIFLQKATLSIRSTTKATLKLKSLG